jgi:ribonuclease D
VIEAGSGQSGFLYLDDQAKFDRFVAALRGADLLAVDTEAASFHRYRDRVYLIQLSSRTTTAIVDPLAVANLGSLGSLLADPDLETVFHDADYDLRTLNRDYGFTATRLFDTRIAAQLLNEPGIGLAALLAKYLGVTLDKRWQRADWSRRPLVQGMLDYAASDTRYLPTLRDILKDQLEQQGRWSWAEEEFSLLSAIRWSPAGTPEEAFLRVKGARTLKGHQLTVLREVFAWRESVADELDRAVFRVVMNDSMLAIARAMPADEQALRELKALSPEQIRRWGADILAAVRRGVGAPPESIPVFERSRRPPPDLAYEARLDRLKTVRNAAAAELPLAPGVLCPNAILEAIARQEPVAVEDLASIGEMRRWQRTVLGERLIAALRPD